MTMPDARPRVLLVEPDDGLRAAVRCLLQAHGYVAAVLETPLDAFAFFRGGGRVDAAVVDVDPGEGGSYSPTETERCLGAVIRNAPTVVCSSRETMRVHAGAIGAAAVVSRLGIALYRLARLVERRRTLRPASGVTPPCAADGRATRLD